MQYFQRPSYQPSNGGDEKEKKRSPDVTSKTANVIFPAKPQPAQAPIAPYWRVPDRWQGSLTDGPMDDDQRIHRPDLWDLAHLSSRFFR